MKTSIATPAKMEKSLVSLIDHYFCLFQKLNINQKKGKAAKVASVTVNELSTPLVLGEGSSNVVEREVTVSVQNFWYFINFAKILVFSLEKPQPQPIVASLPSTPARVRCSFTNLQSSNPSPQSNAPDKIQHDKEGPFIWVEGLGKFRLTAAATESATVSSSRKVDRIVESPIPVSVPPITTLPVTVPDPIPEPPAEAPAEASKTVVKSKSKRKSKATAEPVLPVVSSSKKCNRELELLSQLNRVSGMQIDEVDAPCKKRS